MVADMFNLVFLHTVMFDVNGNLKLFIFSTHSSPCEYVMLRQEFNSSELYKSPIMLVKLNFLKFHVSLYLEVYEVFIGNNY